MPPSEPLRVFISYARKDGAALAQRLQKDLKEQGFDTWLDTQRILGGAVWSMELDEVIDSLQVLIALLSPASYISEICRAEQLRALDKGKRVIPVVAIKGTERPTYLYAKQYRDFTDDAKYAARLAELLADIRGDTTATLPEAYRKTRVTYLTAPPRVANYLERPEALHALRNALFAEDHRQPIALTALHGMGGIGKTVLAKALTEDGVVQRAFPDGIVWITAGKESKRDFIEEMREVAKALGDDLSRYDTALACEHQYRTTIANKAALIVVDDVWSKSDIEPLLAESSRSRFLFTTRDAAIGRFVGAHEHRADLLDVAQSRELLASWTNLSIAELPSAADEVIAQCGRLPLALSVVGAMLWGESAEFWADTLDLLRKADLSAIQEQLPEGQQSFFKAVEVSFQSLKPEMQERYKALAVLLEDMAAPLSILEALWNVNQAEARLRSRLLVDRSLAQRAGDEGSVRLHDLQLDYLRSRYPDREALSLIQGAIRLSANVIERDPRQFTSQLVGRLLSGRSAEAIEQFTHTVSEGAPSVWLRSLWPTLHPPGTPLIRTLEGHSQVVSSVAMSGDGMLAISASSDQTLKVWEVESGRERRTLQGHPNEDDDSKRGHSDYVSCVAVTADGKRAVSGSWDCTLKVWEVESGSVLHTLKGHSSAIYGVAVTPDGQRAVSASDDYTLKVWELASGRELRTLEGHSDSVRGVAVMVDGKRAVSGSDDYTLKVWDLESGSEVRTLEGHTASVYGVAVTADGKRAVSASWDKTLKVWDIESGAEVRNLEGHSASVSCVAVTADGKRAVSASYDKTLKAWDVEGGREIRTLEGHSASIYGVAITGDGKRAISGSWDNTVKVWDPESEGDLRTLKGHLDSVFAVAATVDGRRAVSASWDNTLKVWDLESGGELCSLKGHSSYVYGVAVTADGKRAVSASYDKTLKLWDIESGDPLRTLAGHSSHVFGVAVTSDGKWAISASEDKTLKLWDIESGDPVRTLAGHSSYVFGVAVTSDGKRAVSASADKTLKVWDLDSGLELRTLAGHSEPVWGVALFGNGKRAVSASWDRTLKVWDVESGRELRTLHGHTSWVYGVSVTNDGKWAVSASWDKTLKLWDLDSGAVFATFTCDAPACCGAFSGNHRVIGGDAGGHVHFLRLEEPKAKG